MEGAPLLNAEGKMIGFVTLNYSPHRFLGAAIPIDSQKYVIEILLKKESDKTAPVETGEGTLGVKAEDRAGRIVVTEVVREGAADRAGIRPGDTILGIGKTRIQNCEELWKRLKDMKAGDIVWLTIEADGDSYQVKVTLTGKK
jgi:S1-C subfamily serine protease